jgi:sugar/nucleoside kinase (ribokinase family)
MLPNDCTESAEEVATDINEDMPKPLDVVCFGVLSAMRVATVEEYPKADSGAAISSLMELICADAAITCVALDGLGCRVGLISNDVGNDPDGRDLLDRFKGTDIVTTVTLLGDVSTPFCLTVVDGDGNRTWFRFNSNAPESLLAVDLGLVCETDILYVDVYPEIWQASVRAIDCAFELGVRIFVNLSEHIPNEEVGQRLHQGVAVTQGAAAGQSVEHARVMAQTFFDSYSPSLCVLTTGRHGVIYTNHSGTYHLPAHVVKVANTSGAGAIFSAGLIFGCVQSWPDDEAVAFANALAGLYCSVPEGISCFSATDVMEFAASRALQPTKLC